MRSTMNEKLPLLRWPVRRARSRSRRTWQAEAPIFLWAKASQNLAGLPSSVRNDMKAAVSITSSVDVPAVRGIRVPASSSCLWKMTCSVSLAGITSRALWKRWALKKMNRSTAAWFQMPFRKHRNVSKHATLIFVSTSWNMMMS